VYALRLSLSRPLVLTARAAPHVSRQLALYTIILERMYQAASTAHRPRRGVHHGVRGRSLREHPGHHVQPPLPGGPGLDEKSVTRAAGGPPATSGASHEAHASSALLSSTSTYGASCRSKARSKHARIAGKKPRTSLCHRPWPCIVEGGGWMDGPRTAWPPNRRGLADRCQRQVRTLMLTGTVSPDG